MNNDALTFNLKSNIRHSGKDHILSTVSLPYTYGKYGWGNYESCLFRVDDGNSNVLRRYETKREAIKGNAILNNIEEYITEDEE